jgi:hypothetical protein
VEQGWGYHHCSLILLQCTAAATFCYHAQNASDSSQNESAMHEENSAQHELRRDEIFAARDQFARSLGDVDPDVLTPIINPEFMDGPAWPDLRQAWRVIRRDGSTIILSDGLSDPFPEVAEPNTGFGLEVLVESSDAMPEQLQMSWLFDLAYQVSQQCADHGGIRDMVERFGVVSLELPMNHELPDMLNDHHMAGVLLGIVPPDLPPEFTTPSGSVRIITAKLLWLSELQHIITGGKGARQNLADQFRQDGSYHRSSLLRSAVS